MPSERTTTWLRRVSLWHPDVRPAPCSLDQVDGAKGFPWFELSCHADETPEVFDVLRTYCDGLTPEMLEDLLTPDDSPAGVSYDGGSIRLASTFSLSAEREEEPVERGSPLGVGRLLFQPVEILAGRDWLISCWHPVRPFEGNDRLDDRPPGPADEVFRGIVECGRRGTPADLGVGIMHELALTYAPAERDLISWLEDWELGLYRKDHKKVDDKDLIALWGLMAVMRNWMTPLARPGVNSDIAKAWLPTTDRGLVRDVDQQIEKGLEGLTKLSETLRQAFGLVHVEQADEQRQRAERSTQVLELITAVFLVPTLVVGFYGANTWVPGQGKHWGFWVMVAVLILLSSLTLAAMRSQRRLGAAVTRASEETARLRRIPRLTRRSLPAEKTPGVRAP